MQGKNVCYRGVEARFSGQRAHENAHDPNIYPRLNQDRYQHVDTGPTEEVRRKAEKEKPHK